MSYLDLRATRHVSVAANRVESASHARLFGACGCVSGREGPDPLKRTNEANRVEVFSLFTRVQCARPKACQPG